MEQIMPKENKTVTTFRNNFQPEGIPRKYGITKQLQKFDNKQQAKMRKAIREACGGIGKNTLSAWENIKPGDKAMIGSDYLQKIAKVLYCDITDLLPAENGG